jgi:membrane fusion protein (multidrug efflux system)
MLKKSEQFMPSSKKIVISLLVFVILVAFYYHHKHKAQQAGFMDTPVVNTAKAQIKPWYENLNSVGTVKPSRGVMVSSESEGIVKAIDFQSGQIVKAGTILVELDHQDLDAQAENQKANIDFLTSKYHRNLTVFQKAKAVSQTDLDEMSAQLKEAQADYNKTQALIAQKRITAPFDGTLGINQINLGQYLSRGTPIVEIETLSPIYIDFNLPQTEFGKLHVNDTITIHRSNSNNATDNISAQIIALSPGIDINTRTFTVRAESANTDEQLIPGMSVNIDISATARKPLIIPQSAITYGLDGEAVYVITNGKAHLKKIKIGDRQGDNAEVLSGLTAGDEVVIAGQGKLADNADVQVENTTTTAKDSQR